MTSKRPLGAQISASLEARGVDVIFGIPGVHNIELYRGIEDAGIKHILARHEQGAGFMADGYARATGKPGIAYVITGPGLCNIMTPIGQAYSDSVPLLVIASCLDETDNIKGQLHQMRDQLEAANAVNEWAIEAQSEEEAYQAIDRAYREFQSTRPRPKYLQVPIKVLKGLAGSDTSLETSSHSDLAENVPDYNSLKTLIEQAEKPLIIFGGGARKTDTMARELVAKTGAASFTTYAGRGVLTPDMPLHFGSYLPRGDTKRIIGMADLVIVIGSSLDDVDLWRLDLGHTGMLLRVDIDPDVLNDRHNADIKIEADAGAFIEALVPELTKQDAKWQPDFVSKARRQWRAEVDAEYPGITTIAMALKSALPAGTTIYSDMTQLAYASKEVWDMESSGLWHHPCGFGTLGYALPAAIGGKIGRPDEPVIAIAGDYGFQFTMQELGVAVEHELTLPIILWDNSKLKEIEDAMLKSQIAPNAVVAQNPDFQLLANAYGVTYCKPSSLAALGEDVKASLTANGPTIIHVTPDIL